MDAPAKKSKLIKGATGDWEVVIGLEVHVQVTSEAKLFSGASTAFGGEPNSHVSLVDAAMPGMLPVINAECVRQAVRTGLGLKAKINLKSVFDRKNYFYPDLPQGYQISQYKSPIVGEGEVVVDMPDGETVRVGIERLHLEQDAGKSLHDQNPSMSLVDLNRAGVALMEIVSKPDLRSADEAMAFITKLRGLLRLLGTCDGDMEKGHLRADVNVSVRRAGETTFGTRCEIKNLNSIRFIGQAAEHEARRQIDIIEDNGKIEQETRLFDPDKGETRSMRSKEEAHDYRYFPDPDLLPLELTQSFVDDLQKTLPGSEKDIRAQYLSDELTPDDIEALLADQEMREEFETSKKLAPDVPPKAVLNWLRNDHRGRLRKEGLTFKSSPVSSAANTTIVEMVAKKEITYGEAKELYDKVWTASTPAPTVYRLLTAEDVRGLESEMRKERGASSGELEKIVDDILAKNPDKVADAKANPNAIGWFIGQVRAASGGKANPQAVNDLLKKKISI
jgi:aspartyl-tRNA(Asn)/glutamyl-tRNA(Gln) amidotransferase subunit B